MALNETQHPVTSITDNLPGMVYRCHNDRNWSAEYISQGAIKLTGYTPAELVSESRVNLGSLIIEEDRERVWEEIQAAIKQGRYYTTTYQIRTRQGELKWVWEQGHKVTSGKRNETLLEGIIIDITEQKRTESELYQYGKCFRSIVDGSVEGIFVHRDWRPLFVNQSLADMLGYDSPAEILAMDSVSDIVAPHERPRLSAYAEARMTGGNPPRRYEFEALRRDGSTIILENLASKVNWIGQEAILATLIDVSKRKRAEEEAKRYREQLGHIDRLNVLGEMAAGIAHEINQPLTAILSRCGAARRRINMNNPDLDKLRIALEAIEQQAHRTGEVIERVRTLAKHSTGQRESFNINALIKQCVEFAELDDRIDSIHLKIDLNHSLPSVIGDPIQVQQVILNLMRNACEAMTGLPPEQRILTLAVGRHDQDTVQVSICDNGSGISESTEKGLFQSFFTTKELGLGMGLSISRSIIDANGGSLWFTRNPEQGVTFRFTLPVTPEKAHE